MKLVALLALVLLAAPAAAQTNPCAAPMPTVPVAVAPGRAMMTAAEHAAVLPNNDPAVSFYQIAYFAQGANPATATPIQGPSTLQKSGFTLQSGTTNCYVTALPLPVPTGVTAVAAIRAVRTATPNTPAAESPWSAISNAFFLAPVPQAPRLIVVP